LNTISSFNNKSANKTGTLDPVINALIGRDAANNSSNLRNFRSSAPSLGGNNTRFFSTGNNKRIGTFLGGNNGSRERNSISINPASRGNILHTSTGAASTFSNKNATGISRRNFATTLAKKIMTVTPTAASRLIEMKELNEGGTISASLFIIQPVFILKSPEILTNRLRWTIATHIRSGDPVQ